MTSCILVATDGHPGARGALRAARQMAERSGARVEVLAVHEPADLYLVGSPEAVAGFPVHLVSEAVEELRRRVGEQLAEMGEGAGRWPITVEVGRVVPTIALHAARCGADVVLVGLAQPGAVERWFAREMLLRLVHLAHAPVMAVRQDAAGLPERVVLATDFSAFSSRVAGEVIERAAPGARLHLAHVMWTPVQQGGWSDSAAWVESYRAGVDRRLREQAAGLEQAGGIEVEVHVLAGDPRREILRLAEEVDADLIAAGSHGAGFLGRVLLGSVSSRLVHRARTSLLIVPPEEVAPELELEVSRREVMEDLGTAAELDRPTPPPSG